MVRKHGQEPSHGHDEPVQRSDRKQTVRGRGGSWPPFRKNEPEEVWQ
jgi:hypothetical protein